MDTSKEYIKMCDCSEIQALRMPDCGCVFKLGKPDNRIVILVEHPAKTILPITWLVRVAFPKATGDNIDYKYIKNAIWLPRQDQLQEMIDWTQWQLNARFSEFVHMEAGQNNPTSLLSSMEQLWLAFVMKEKHNKMWNGKSWIKVE